MGDPRTEEGFRALLNMDVVHHVKDGIRYPAVILDVGLNDNRVSPWESAKLAARLQTATSSRSPVLLRIEAEAGHGVGSGRGQLYAAHADIWSFFLQQAGDPAFHASR
jgi:prolyl oligopeptidase